MESEQASGPEPDFYSDKPHSKEYESMCKLVQELIRLVAQSPDSICDAMFSKGYLADEQRSFVRMATNLPEDKAKKLVHTMTDRVKNDNSSYYSFIEILECQGPWTGHVVEKLRRPNVKSPRPSQELPWSPTDEQEPTRVPGMDEQTSANLEGRLIEDIIKIGRDFNDFVSSLKKSFQANQVKPIDVAEDLLMIKAVTKQLQRDTDVPELLHGIRKDLMSSKSIDDVLCHIGPFVSFFNYHIIELIVHQHGYDTDKNNFELYLRKFEEFCKRKATEVPSNVDSENSHSTYFKVKVESDLQSTYTVKAVNLFRTKLCEILSINEACLRLLTLQKGCVLMTFLIPSFLVSFVFPLTQEQERSLFAEGVSKYALANDSFHTISVHDAVIRSDSVDENYQSTQRTQSSSSPKRKPPRDPPLSSQEVQPPTPSYGAQALRFFKERRKGLQQLFVSGPPTMDGDEPTIETQPLLEAVPDGETAGSISLVTINKHTQLLEINPKALEMLRSKQLESTPVAVLGICGPYRSGKSYFLCQVMGSDDFEVSNKQSTCTQGIHIATNALTFKNMKVLVLDTEGIGDPAAGQTSEAVVMKYFILTTLLTSLLIYNSQGAIKTTDLDQMSFFGELSQSILVRNCQGFDLQQYLPDFVWLLRDNVLGLPEGTQSITQHVNDNILVTTSSTGKRNDTVRSIKQAFPSMECIQLPFPGNGFLAGKKSTPKAKFTEALKTAERIIFSKIKEKYGFNKEKPLDGPMLAELLVQYVEALNKPDTVPNLELSYKTAVENRVNNLIDELVIDYSESMEQYLKNKLPMEQGSVQDLESAHSEMLESCLSNTIPFPSDHEHNTPITPDCLFEIHKKVYADELLVLYKEIQGLIPSVIITAQQDSLTMHDDAIMRQKQFLLEFQGRIIKTRNGAVHNICKLFYFSNKNWKCSETFCEEKFNEIYREHLRHVSISLEKLKEEYNISAVGPAKEEVLESRLKNIPGAPLHFSTVAKTDKDIVVSWQSPKVNQKAVHYYEILCLVVTDQYSVVEKNSPIVVYTSNSRTKKIESTVQNLKPFTQYSLKVRGANDTMKGEYSAEMVVQTLAGKPDTPEPPTITVTSATEGKLLVTMLHFSKQNGSRVTHVQICQRSEHAIDWEERDHEVNSNDDCDRQSFPIVLKRDPKSSHLSLRIRMKNNIGYSFPSSSIILSADDMIPGIVSEINYTAEARKVILQWGPPNTHPLANTVLSYCVQSSSIHNHDQGPSWKENISNHKETTLTVDQLNPKSNYTFRIFCKSNHLLQSEPVQITVETLADKPERPHKPTIKVVSATKAELSFRSPSLQHGNGSIITHVVLEKAKKDPSKSSRINWDREEPYPIPATADGNVSVEFDLDNVIRPVITMYRLCFVNSIGESKPSEEYYELQPHEMIPGSPQALSGETWPQSPQALENTFQVVKLTWKEPDINPAAVDSYNVSFKKSKESIWTKQVLEYTTDTCVTEQEQISKKEHTAEIYGLAPNIEYEFRVRATNTEPKEGEYCQLITVRTKPSFPPKPQQPNVTYDKLKSCFRVVVHLPAIEASGIEVNSFNINHFKLDSDYKLTFVDTTKYKINKEDLNEHRLVTKTIDFNTDKTHFVSITLINEVGQSKQSEFTPVCSDNVKPGEPQDFQVTPFPREAQLEWKAPNKNTLAANCYRVQYRKESEDQDWKYSETYSQVDEKLEYKATIKSLRPNTKYNFKVCSMNNTIEGFSSSCTECTKTCEPDKPAHPTIIPSLKDPLKATVQFHLLSESQMNGSELKGVIVECKEGNEWKPLKSEISDDSLQGFAPKTGEMVIKSMPSVSSSEIKHLSFCIRMKNDNGESEQSDEYSVLVSSLAPGKPEEIDLSYNEKKHFLTVTWKQPNFNPSLINGYCVKYGVAENGVFKELHVKPEQLECELPELEFGQTYEVGVSACNHAIKGPSAKKTVTTPVVYPSKPRNLRIEKTGVDKIKVRWNKPSDYPEKVHHYQVSLFSTVTVKNVLQARNVLQTRKSKGYSTVFANLESSTTYIIRVTSFNQQRNASHTAVTDCTVETKMSVAKRVLYGVAVAVPTLGLAASHFHHTYKPDSNIDVTDDEYEDSSATDLNAIISIDKIEAQWSKPATEVKYFQVELHVHDEAHKSQVLETHCTEKLSFVFQKLKASTTYTISVTPLNPSKGDTLKKKLTTHCTEMSGEKQAATDHFHHTHKPDSNIGVTDDKYEDSSATDLNVKISINKIEAHWSKPATEVLVKYFQVELHVHDEAHKSQVLETHCTENLSFVFQNLKASTTYTISVTPLKGDTLKKKLTTLSPPPPPDAQHETDSVGTASTDPQAAKARESDTLKTKCTRPTLASPVNETDSVETAPTDSGSELPAKSDFASIGDHHQSIDCEDDVELQPLQSHQHTDQK